MSAYRPYPKYKPSGVEWLGEVPEGWEVLPGRRLFKQKRDPRHPDDEQLSATQKYGVIPQSLFMQKEDQKLVLALSGIDAFKHVQKDDFVISLRSFQGGIEHSAYAGCVSPAYTVLHPNRAVVPKYFAHALKCDSYVAALQAGTDGIREGKSISYEQFGAIPLPLPPLPEQHQIAAFLDRECAKLDALQAKQERLIALLKEKRQALISHAVTRGLDPSAPLKPSGIEWLGDVPEHWIPSKVKWVSEAVKTGGTPSDSSWFTDEAGVPWLTPGDFSDENFKISPRRFVSQGAITKREAPSFPVSSIFVVGIGATLGKVARLTERKPASSNQQINAIVPSKVIESDYLLYSLVAQPEQMKNCSNASTLGIMNQEKTSGLHIALPPLAEQHAIVAHLDEKCGKIDRLKAKAERAIELLKERRSALISAAVTGKIDVREAAAAVSASQP